MRYEIRNGVLVSCKHEGDTEFSLRLSNRIRVNGCHAFCFIQIYKADGTHFICVDRNEPGELHRRIPDEEMLHQVPPEFYEEALMYANARQSYDKQLQLMDVMRKHGISENPGHFQL